MTSVPKKGERVEVRFGPTWRNGTTLTSSTRGARVRIEYNKITVFLPTGGVKRWRYIEDISGAWPAVKS